MLKYLGAHFKELQNRDGDGHPFVPDCSDLPDFLENLSQTSQDNIVKSLLYEQVKFVVFKKCDKTKVLILMVSLTNFTRSLGR